MTVLDAKNKIADIDKLIDDLDSFDKNNPSLSSETDSFVLDTIDCLCDYRKILANAINRAEINL